MPETVTLQTTSYTTSWDTIEMGSGHYEKFLRKLALVQQGI